MSDTSSRDITLGIGKRTFKIQRDRTVAFRPAFVATIDVDGAVQPLSIKSGGVNLHAGSNSLRSDGAYVGSVTLVPHGQLHPTPITTPASQATCPDRIDWVETP